MILADMIEAALACAPACPEPARWAASLAPAAARFEIYNRERVAAWIAQLAHESAEFTRLEENLNYSGTRLMQVFPKYFPDYAAAKKYQHKPEAIANKVYGDRLGNGSEASGDGWRYRGRGLIQLTGRDNYRNADLDLQLGLEANPNLALAPGNAALIAAWFWADHGCNANADRGWFKTITVSINGGLNGIEQRAAYWKAAKARLGIK